MVTALADAHAISREDTFYSGIATACGMTGKIEYLEVFLAGGDPTQIGKPEPAEVSSGPFLRHVLGGPDTGDEVTVAKTADGEYDIEAFFAED